MPTPRSSHALRSLAAILACALIPAAAAAREPKTNEPTSCARHSVEAESGKQTGPPQCREPLPFVAPDDQTTTTESSIPVETSPASPSEETTTTEADSPTVRPPTTTDTTTTDTAPDSTTATTIPVEDDAPSTTTTSAAPTTTSSAVPTTSPSTTTGSPTTSSTTTTPPASTKLVFHVATNGSDGNDGSAARPWASLGHALDQIPASGDATVWVGPGTYDEQVETTTDFAAPVRVISAQPYKARLTSPQNTVLVIKSDRVSFEGFEIVGQPASGSSGLVYMWKADGSALRNNVIHDSYDNDGIRVLSSNDVVIAGNVLYNSADHMIDVNIGSQRTIIENNIFFADYAGSGRSMPSNLSAFIVIKFSGEAAQTTGGTVIRRNVFTHYEGEKYALKIGADGETFHEALDITVEANLFHHVGSPVKGAFEVIDAAGVVFRSNTFLGDDFDERFAGWVGTREGSPPSENVNFFANVFAAPGGGMDSVIESPTALVTSGTISGNLYWNGGATIPEISGDRFNYTSDAKRILADPGLTTRSVVLPRWNGTGFDGGHATIRDAFVAYVSRHATPAAGGPTIGAGGASASAYDIFGNARGSSRDVGAVER